MIAIEKHLLYNNIRQKIKIGRSKSVRARKLAAAFFISFGLLIIQVPMSANAKGDIVIAIDPGHGGTGDRNMGAMSDGYIEKQMTMATAIAMKEELEKYDGVRVYLTRTEDKVVSLSDRAQIAQNAGADFLFSLHYNASSDKALYGTEIWQQSAGSFYQKGYSAGDLLIKELTGSLGTYNRGVKVKLGESGKDYYGILRETAARKIPAVIIEHCYLDNAVDRNVFADLENLQNVGKIDATAVAKYFGLESKSLGVSYKNYPKVSVKEPKVPKGQDMTPPEVVQLQLLRQDAANSRVEAAITAKDSESQVLYYQYSVDNGVTWSLLQPFDRNAETINVSISAVPNQGKTMIMRAYNGYDYFAQSNAIIY